MIEHKPGHRVRVAVVTSPDERSSFARYACFDPTCDWCVTELTGPIEAFYCEDLTDGPEIDDTYKAIFRGVARRPSGRCYDEGQTDLFPHPEG